MEKMKVLNTKGEKVSDVKLNETVWAIEPNDTVLYDAITLTQKNIHLNQTVATNF